MTGRFTKYCHKVVMTTIVMLGYCASISAADSPLDELLKTFVDEFVSITPGEGAFPAHFEMGSKRGESSEQPVHRVTMKERFAMGRYEVPQNLYQEVMGSNPSKWKGPRNSVEMMTFGEANDFCRKITEMAKAQKLISADEIVRLPTEAEWEYCCRAGTTTAFSFGDSAQAPGDTNPKATLLNPYGWHTGNAAGNDPPVGALKPNPWKLYDMHGYLWEFTSDAWTADYEKASETGVSTPIADSTKTIAIRGGSWKDDYKKLTSSTRKSFPITGKDDAVGFRCVLSKTTP